jgi:hypothetical protein
LAYKSCSSLVRLLIHWARRNEKSMQELLYITALDLRGDRKNGLNDVAHVCLFVYSRMPHRLLYADRSEFTGAELHDV